VAAAVKAEVLAGDANPLEVLGRGEHPLDQLPVAILDPPALDQRLPRLGRPGGEIVAHRLELAEVEHPWPGAKRLDPVRHLGVAERLAEERCQLGLEAGDLRAKLQPRLALVDRSAR